MDPPAQGALAGHALDDGFDRRVDFGLTAPPEGAGPPVGRRPPPRHQSLFALLSKVPEFAVEGDREALAQHAHVVARLLELGRPAAGAATDGAGGRAGAGRPLRRHRPLRRVALSTGAAQLYAEQAGEGRDLLFLHTAGSDGRQYHHLLADPALRADGG